MTADLTNKHADALASAALKRFTRNHKIYADDINMTKMNAADYIDLMKIVWAIENEKDSEKIAAMMYSLDTEVRDSIPNSVYNYYNKE